MEHPTRYTLSGGLHVAWQEAGSEERDLVYVPTWISQVEQLVSEPGILAFLERVCSFARVITFDRRGSGLSDPIVTPPTLEDQMDDVLAVMDAAGSERASLLGSLEGGLLAMAFAASHPERVEALVLYATFPRASWAPDYDWGSTDEERAARIDALVAQWGQGAVALALAPSKAGDPAFRDWAGRIERYSASPGTIRQILGIVGRTDVRDVLPTIRVPTLVMHRRDDQFLAKPGASTSCAAFRASGGSSPQREPWPRRGSTATLGRPRG